MTFGKTHNLVSSGSAAHYLKPGGVPIPLVQPPNPMDFGSYADELTWQIRVASVVGDPTAYSFRAKFQMCMPNTTGYQYEAPVWYDLGAPQVAKYIVEGEGWYSDGNEPPTGGNFGLIASEPTPLPVGVQRTIRHFGLRCRLLLDLQMTGGTDPGLRVDINVHAKG